MNWLTRLLANPQASHPAVGRVAPRAPGLSVATRSGVVGQCFQPVHPRTGKMRCSATRFMGSLLWLRAVIGTLNRSGTGVSPVRTGVETHGRDARATTRFMGRGKLIAVLLLLSCAPAALLAQPLSLPLEIHQPDTLWNLQSVRGVPIST